MDDNNYKNHGGYYMSKKKKNKVQKLTDEQYNAYLMALKDEVPPKIVRETQSEQKWKVLGVSAQNFFRASVCVFTLNVVKCTQY